VGKACPSAEKKDHVDQAKVRAQHLNGDTPGGLHPGWCKKSRFVGVQVIGRKKKSRNWTENRIMGGGVKAEEGFARRRMPSC